MIHFADLYLACVKELKSKIHDTLLEQTTDGNEQPCVVASHLERKYCTIQLLAIRMQPLQPDEESPDQNRQRKSDLQAQS